MMSTSIFLPYGFEMDKNCPNFFKGRKHSVLLECQRRISNATQRKVKIWSGEIVYVGDDSRI